MSTSQRTFEQVKSILGKLDRDIDAARQRRLHTRPLPIPTPAFSAPLAPAMPAPVPPMRSLHGTNGTSGTNVTLSPDTAAPGLGRLKAVRTTGRPNP